MLLADAGTSGRGAAQPAAGGRGRGARGGAGGAAAGAPQAAAVGPEAADAALLKPSVALEGLEGAPGRRKRRAEEPAASANGGALGGAGDAAGAPAGGLTLGQRLAALQLQANGPVRAARARLLTHRPFVRACARPPG